MGRGLIQFTLSPTGPALVDSIDILRRGCFEQMFLLETSCLRAQKLFACVRVCHQFNLCLRHRLMNLYTRPSVFPQVTFQRDLSG